MAAPISVGKKTVLGKTSWWIVPTLTTTGPLVTEVNSVSGLNITGFLLGDQDSPGGDTPKVELPKLLLETSTTETLDATKVTVPDFRFGWDPQASAAANDKKAWALLKDGYSGYLVSRDNVVSATSDAITAGQFINWFQVNASIGIPKKSATDASGIYVFDVSFACLTFKYNIAVA
jgi:hypothetical protein